MELTTIVTGFTALAGGISLGYIMGRNTISSLKIYLKNTANQLEKAQFDLQQKEKEVKESQTRAEQFLEEKTAAITRMETSSQQVDDLQNKYQEAETKRDAAIQEKFEALQQVERMKQELTSMREHMQDWEKTKEESLKTAKEAMFTTGSDIFRKEAESINQKTTESFQAILQSVATLNDRVSKSAGTVDTLWRTLASPGTAGNFSEFGLENTFKRYGLEPGRDFVTQYSVSGETSGSKLRPDAVVFLPGNNLLVIDSKASKFFLELAEVEGTPQETERLEQLKRTMQEHLRSLASKGYKDAVREYYNTSGLKEKPGHILTVMFIQSEAAIEKIYKADPTFRQKAEEQEIILSGPTGLAGLMSFARYDINSERQLKNQETIMEEISKLLSSLEIVVSHAIKLGKGIESTANHYNRFTKSVNGNLLPKARRIHNLGINLPSNKQLPVNMPTYHVLADTSPLIEGEVHEIIDENKFSLENK